VDPHREQHENNKSDELEGEAAGDEIDRLLLLVCAAVGHRHCSHDLQHDAGDVDEDVNLRDPGDADDRVLCCFQGARHSREGHVD